jgi:hypothetical protein
LKSNKKLFAILTLMMFLMTLVPMAAFGAEGNRYASTFSINANSAIADGSAYIEATVYIANAAGPQAGEEVIITTNRGVLDTLTWDTTAYTVSANGNPVTNASGKVVVKVQSTVKGAAKLAAAVAYNPYGGTFANIAAHKTALINYLNGSTTNTADQVMVIAANDVTFTSPSAGTVNLVAGGAVTADGLSTITLTASVLNGTTPVSGEEVTFNVNKTGLSFDKTSYTSDAMGIVIAKVTANAAGTYAVTASAGGKTSTSVNAVFNASAIAYTLEFMKETTTLIAKGVASTNLIKVKVMDMNGNKISVGAPITTSIKTKPSGSIAGIPTLNVTNTDASGYFQFDFTPDLAGAYVLRFALANGKYIETNVNAQAQGTITGLTISYDTKSLAIPAAGANASVAATVKQVDAAGVSKTATGALSFSSSNPTVATVGATGIITTATNDAKKAEVITITVVDTTNNLVATTTMPIVGPPSTLAAAVSGVVEVNKSATVTLTFKDINGNAVSLGAAPATAFSVTSKPAGAGVNVSYAATAGTDFTNKGESTATVSSTVAGTVKVTFLVTVGANVYTATADVVVGAAKVAIGAKAVTMFIGATGFVQDGVAKVTDVAPFILDGRTFLAVRPVAEAFGAEIGWNATSGTVTLTRTDMTLTIVIGSNVITKVAGGITTTSVADVAAFIKDGRTVLPFRAVGEAFGATVAWDATTQAVSFTQ